ncbi:hypothetical protein SSX86_015837 [Deinandra increscens subsp. villosa]|uniref:Uncharacterized protein n=1 Tax=Deinandra increscens subsp. villosa TaxID=3103831 RepID=A0AAP0GZF4_9ASTR
MDNIASSIITPVVQSLMAPVKKYLGFFFCSTKYVKKMEEKMDQLSLTEQDIRSKWEQAVTRTHEVSHHVEPWLDEVKTVSEEARKIPTGGIGCFHMAKRYKAGKQSSDILDEIEALEKRGSEIKFSGAPRPLAEVASTSSIGPSTSSGPYDTQHNFFESRKSVFDEALKALQSNNESQKIIALSGMGGEGGSWGKHD